VTSTHRAVFPHSPHSIVKARRFASDVLKSVLPPETLDAVLLMVSELASNSVRHAQTGFELTLQLEADEVRVVVSDEGPGEVALQSPDPRELSGRGLRLVHEFSDAWDVVPASNGAGKAVWFSVALRANSPERSR
jgi:anti-sigma regulatory factor (Ser/Thr protein kinase)